MLPLRATIGPFVTGLLVFLGIMLLLTPLSLQLSRMLALSPGQGDLAQVFLLPALCLALSIAFVKVFARPTLSIGIDGILVRRRLRRRFIPYAAIESVEFRGTMRPTREPGHRSDYLSPPDGSLIPVLQLKLRDELVSLPIVDWSSDDLHRAADRIEEARAAASEEAGVAAGGLARRGQSVAAWRTGLRRLLSADPSFRERRLTLEETEHILADPAIPLEQRVGAALALRAVEPDRAGERIRFAAEAAAEIRVRVALLAALEGDDTATEAALNEATLAETELTEASAAASPRRGRA